MLKNISSCVIRMIAPRIVCCARGYAASRIKRKKTPSIKPPKASTDEIGSEKNVCPHFISRAVGLHPLKWSNVFDKHPEMKSLSRVNALNTIRILKSMNYSAEDIYSKPTILCVNGTTIENRYCVLQECGIEPISVARLFKYITVMNKNVLDLKAQQYVPYDVDVFNKLCNAITDVVIVPDPRKYSENMKLKSLREIVLNDYLRQRLNMNDEDMTKLWKSYSRIRHRSFQSTQSIIKLLIEDFKFSKERIVKNAFLLYADAENVRRIMKEIPTIGSQDIRDIGYRRPKILMSNCDALLKTLQHVKSFGIKEEAVTRCLEVLTLGPDTILERLRDLNEIEEFRVLTTNPRVLRLVHYQNKARLRLEYLNQIKVRCASLHLLSCGSEAFAKFAREGSDRTKGRDIVIYLSNVMKQDATKIRNILSRHPNWCHTPSLHVKQVYEFLLGNKFTSDEIFQNIHLLLYPIKRIEEKITLLKKPDTFEDMDLPNIDIFVLSNSEILALVLYLIECEFHFTGDGIWTEQNTHHVENFKNLLPDFPEVLNKVYKYGVKPTSNQKLAMQPSPT